MEIIEYPDGYAICGDSTQVSLTNLIGQYHMVMADPPYGNIVDEEWDKVTAADEEFAAWMQSWTLQYASGLVPGGALYVWGGIGRPGFRPFMHYLANIERDTNLTLHNIITWSKKRAYGVQNNYLFTREECAYLINGKKPCTFNIPLLDQRRGYAGYNAKYPAKSEYLRRTNVWTDITEIFKGKKHPTQKAHRVIEIPIEVSTNPGEWVVDPFAGAGTTAMACRKLGRRFVVIEKDPAYFEVIKNELASQ